jgi:secreted PhoX family phosphatase
MTEDDSTDSRFYRFRPTVPGTLAAGVLEAASVAAGRVTWIPVSATQPARGRDTTPFARGEGAWYSAGIIYFTTTADSRVWALNAQLDTLEIIYDAALLGDDAPLREPDNVTVHERSGDIYVGEDDDDRQLVLLADQFGQRIAAPFMQLIGHDGSEVTGPAFNPNGSRLYFTSQRGTGGAYNDPGMTFEITGPFRGA